MQWINAAVLLAKVEMKRFCQPHRSRMLISYHPFPQPKTTWSLFSCARSLAQCINAAMRHKHAMRSWEQIPRRFCSFSLQASGFTWIYSLLNDLCIFVTSAFGSAWRRLDQEVSAIIIIGYHRLPVGQITVPRRVQLLLYLYSGWWRLLQALDLSLPGTYCILLFSW